MNVPDEWVETAAKAYIMATTNGCCDQWPRPCADCDCFRDECPDMRAGYDREAARAALEAVWPLVEARVVAARAEAFEEAVKALRAERADSAGSSYFDGLDCAVGVVAALRDGGGQ